ncbi:MAG: phenylalanyl-tRNA synthetase alpha chain [Bradymonadia bacterium]|jgi:phenylalanyl-tRNA synthetase alpha chain
MSDQPLVLDQTTATVWRALRDGPMSVKALVDATGFDQSQVMVVAQATPEFVALDAQARQELDPADDLAEILAAGLPERRAAELVAAAGGAMGMADFVAATKAAGIAMKEVFRYGGQRGWLNRQKGDRGPVILVDEAAAAALKTPAPDEQVLQQVVSGVTFADALVDVDVEAALKLLKGRTSLVKIRPRTRRVLTLTPAGAQALDTATVKIERSQLTQDDLRSGAWQNIELKPYDITLPSATVYPAKSHPVRKVIEQTRNAFLELGFEEVASPAVESAFWNFDALFQPQDHPARDMQDTFYMADPPTAPLPEDAIVKAVQAAHTDGGDTGSTGWGYKWTPERALATVLRTHATASTIRALARHPNPPYKAFCVGWTHRNETLSYKHLPVFHQVDGIVIDEHASLATLLGTLSAFYKKMGFKKVRFKPAFYPYTEPSVDVMVYMESRGKWIEMGGSGIFRPEVTEPLGCKHPVIAWGLGVERLAMLRLGFNDIRELYQGGLDIVEGVPLCR